MLVTNKNHLFSFLFGKRHASDMPKADSLLKAQTAKVNDLTELEERTVETSVVDLRKVFTLCNVNSFFQLNK